MTLSNSDQEKYWKTLWKNVNMSSIGGAAGMRTETNPKLSGRIRKGNQSTRRHHISITIDDLKEQWEIQNGLCYWLDISMSLPDLAITRSPFAPSVDRINSSVGYVKDNIVLCTRFANLGRGAYDREDFKPRLISLLGQRKSLTNVEESPTLVTNDNNGGITMDGIDSYFQMKFDYMGEDNVG
jgi:hypothetical protein